MKKMILALVLVNQSAFSQEVNTSVEFERSSLNPKNFEPFEISGLDGTPIPLDGNFVLEQTENVKKVIRDDASKGIEKLKERGYAEVTSITEKALQPVKVSVKEYLDEFNGAEKKLSSIGYSIKEGAKIARDEVQKFDFETVKEQTKEAAEVYLQEKVELLEQRRDEMQKKLDDLKKQAEENGKPKGKEAVYLDASTGECGERNAGATTVTEGDTKCFIESIEQKETPFLSPEPPTCKADTPLGKAFLVNETWTDGGGDKNFGWSADASFKLNTDASGIHADSQATAKATVFNKSKEIIKAVANFNTGRTGKATSYRTLELLGKKMVTKDESFSMNLVTSQDEQGKETLITHQDTPLFSQTFVVGFIPILVAVDSRVSTGPRYSLDLAPVKIFGKVEWVTKVTIIASAGIGADLKLFVILAGIKGYIDLVNATVGAYPYAELVLDEKNRPRIGAQLSALADLVTLSGQLDIGVWAKSTFSVPQPKKSFPFIEFKPLDYEWSQTLGRYPGYRFPTATLFDIKVGYDICSGRKEKEVILANQPRPRDERETLVERRNGEVMALEAAFVNSADEVLNDEISIKMNDDAAMVGSLVNAVNNELEQKSQAILLDLAL